MLRTPLQRVGPLALLPAVLSEWGVPLDAVFTDAGIAPQDLVPDARLPMPALVGLLERAARLSGRGDLGLRLGERADHRMLGLVGEMMTRAPTLGDALRDYVGLQIGYSRSATVYLQRLGDHVAIGYGIYDGPSPGGRQIYDLVTAVGCNMIRALTAGKAQPVRVLQCCRPPRDGSAHSAVLRVGVQFDQEQTCVILAAADLALPLPTAHAAERTRLRDLARAAARGDLDDLSARVRHALRPRLMTGEAGRDQVARELAVSTRTLARQLAARGTTFEDIKDQVRGTVARELLALTELPVGRVAEALDYTTHSAFDHAFQRWTGTTPTRWRATQSEA
ncbi:AraC family transcriptional regulator [Xanthobacter tagetidis]|uniref:AraC family transcriptional regulator n=1 Tax=Xanthobacter tagetidis TaxID=60216 RepID=A0A3L7A5Q2_9HYPH|nr:AraC family transcriptional regulator [Xanthobacter tagetidis]MBB6310067.1 AraC-like DNA-binding protein [Xanthobacter tagetidis]RLP75170.1 AraC family transcriptional regulator [Xanthobacter tagetidis]